MLFEDLAVYFSQEESVSLHPALRSLSRDTTPECFEGMALTGKAIIFLAFWNFGQSCDQDFMSHPRVGMGEQDLSLG